MFLCKSYKWIGRRHCWLQKLVLWQVPFPLLLHISWLFVHVPWYINNVHMWEVRGKAHTAHTQGCWTLPIPSVYRCYPLLNDGQVGRSSVAGQRGSHTSWGSFVRMWRACLWAVLLQKVYHECNNYANWYEVKFCHVCLTCWKILRFFEVEIH